MPSLAHDGSLRIAGSGVSTMYHWVCRWFATSFPLVVQSIAVSSVPNWGILDLLSAVRHVVDGLSHFGEPSALIHLGNSLANACSGMTLPPALVSTLHLRVTSSFDLISAGIWTVTKASVVESI